MGRVQSQPKVGENILKPLTAEERNEEVKGRSALRKCCQNSGRISKVPARLLIIWEERR